MKKLLVVLAVVLVSASMASAGLVNFRVAPGDEQASYAPSTTITIEVYLDAAYESTSIILDQIKSNEGGTASSPSVNSKYDQFPSAGDLINTGGVLIEWAEGASSVGDLPTEVLYSFEFHVPDVPGSTYIDIWAVDSIDYLAEVGIVGETAEVPGALRIHVPEPMTFALLGLGGLFLRRRK